MKVLVPIDGSAWSDAAMDVVAAYSWPPGTFIRLLHVVKPLESLLALVDDACAERLAADLDMHVGVVDRAVSTIAGQLGERLRSMDVRVDSQVFVGSIRDEILRVAEAWGADLIVIGSQGKGAIDKLLLGSVSQAVLKHATCPVLVVKTQDESGLFSSEVTRVLVAIDHSPSSSAAIEWMIEQPWPRPLHIRLLTVLKPPSAHYTHELDSELASRLMTGWQNDRYLSAAILNDWVRRVSERLPGSTASFDIAEGDPRHTILHQASDWQADLIVMGSHGRQGMVALLLGSVSQAVSNHSVCSLVVVRGRQARLHHEIHELVRRSIGSLMECDVSTPGDDSTSGPTRGTHPPMSLM